VTVVTGSSVAVLSLTAKIKSLINITIWIFFVDKAWLVLWFLVRFTLTTNTITIIAISKWNVVSITPECKKNHVREKHCSTWSFASTSQSAIRLRSKWLWENTTNGIMSTSPPRWRRF
jgi:hypothetical protein